MRNKRIKEIFAKLKEGHVLWIRGDNDYKDRLEKAFDPLFIELEKLGVTRHFSQALLFSGKEFVVSFMNDKEIRESKLADKSNALVYISEPMKGDKVGIKVLSYKKK